MEIATAACILHNFCILNADPWDGEMYAEPRVQDGGNIGGHQNAGQIKRNRITDELFN